MAALVSGGAPVDFEGAKLTSNVDFSAPFSVSATVGVLSDSGVPPFSTVDSIIIYLN